MPSNYAKATDKGRVRASNEDAIFANPPVFMVADGMGGAQAGEVASSIVVKAFNRFELKGAEPEEELTELIVKTNDEILELAGSHRDHSGMGTTVTAAAIAGQSVSIANVGDSRAYLYRDGKLSQLTEDHSLVGEMLRQGQISESEAETHPQRSIITRALGIEPAVEVDTLSIPWKDRDVFLLCSDGLYSMVPDSEIATAIEKGESLDTTAAALIKEANIKGGRDNISLILFEPGKPGRGVKTAGSAKTGTQKIKAEGLGQSEVREKPETRRPAGSLSGSRLAWLSTCKGRALLAFLLAIIILAGSWLATRNIFFLDAHEGRLAIYRGLPFEVGPISFFSLYSESSVDMDDLDSYEQERAQSRELRSLDDAEKVVDNYNAIIEKRQEEERREAEAATGAASLGSQTATTPAATTGGPDAAQ